MHTRSRGRIRRRSALAAALALVAALSLTSLAGAQTTGDVPVTAEVTTFTASLTLTFCDQTADFGTGLDAFGNQSPSTDSVTSIPANPGSPSGAAYRWDPNCEIGTSFLHVTSNVNWAGTVCGTPGTGTSSLQFQDLRWIQSTSFLPYSTINSSIPPFELCSATPTTWAQQGPTPAEGTGFSAVYYLLVAADEQDGTFTANTTWSVAPT